MNEPQKLIQHYIQVGIVSTLKLHGSLRLEYAELFGYH
jgi:hypothetical protein